MKKIIEKSFISLLALFILIPFGRPVQVHAEELPKIRQLMVMQNAILVLREDRTVIPIRVDLPAGTYNPEKYLLSEQDFAAISQWTEIEELACCKYLLVGLKTDGTVETVWQDDYYSGQFEEQHAAWKNVKKVESGYRYVGGIREDGTIVTLGAEPEGYSEEYGFFDCLADWTDVVKLEIGVCGAGEYAAALRSNGTVVYEGIYDVGWSGPSDHIVDLACSGWMLIAVREDGSVVANGVDSSGASLFRDWKDMKQVDCGDTEAVGLRKDGTICVTSEGRSDLLMLRDVERIELEMYNYLAAYRSNGSVWIQTYYVDEPVLEETRAWTDIKQVSVSIYNAEAPFVLGLKTDGTVASAGIDFEALYRKAIVEKQA